MASIIKEITINTVPIEFVVSVRFGKEGRFRLWLASQLIRLAGIVLSGKSCQDVDYGELIVENKRSEEPMTKDQVTVLLIRGVIAGLPEADRIKCLAQYETIKKMTEAEPLTGFALALAAAELAAA